MKKKHIIEENNSRKHPALHINGGVIIWRLDGETKM